MKKENVILNWVEGSSVPFDNVMDYLTYIKNNDNKLYFDLEGTCKNYSDKLGAVFNYINTMDVKNGNNIVDIIKELDVNAYNRLIVETYKSSVEVEENLRKQHSCVEKTPEQILTNIMELKNKSHLNSIFL